jgi:hypothetical protein
MVVPPFRAKAGWQIDRTQPIYTRNRHSLIVSKGRIGDTYIRSVRIVGDELIVQLQTTTLDGTPITSTNTFSRLT